MAAPHDGAPLVGISLHSDPEFLDLTRDCVEEDCEILEVTSETLWRPAEAGGIRANDYHRMFLELRERTGLPFVAHGVELSPGTADASGPLARRTEEWLRQIRLDHARFDFLWYTEHLGFCSVDERYSALPLPLPPTREAVAACRARLGLLREVVGTAGFENSANYFFLGPLASEPGLFNAICGDDLHVLLDLHNVYTQCLNSGIDPRGYLEGLAFDRVIEIHVSGGSESEAEWLDSGRVFRLDSHDGPVPEEVWALLDHVLPRCPNLGAVIVERMTGTLDAASAADYRDEVRRAKRAVAAARRRPESQHQPPAALPTPDQAEPPLREVQEAVMTMTTAAAPLDARETERARRPGLGPMLDAVDPDGLELTSLIVRKLRFERLVQGSREAAYWFEERPAELARVFGDYHAAVAPTAIFPSEEAAAFEEWTSSS